MASEVIILNEAQKEAIDDLDAAMKNLFIVFIRVDEVDLSISDALEAIGMDIPLFAKPAVNQLSGRIKEMRREVAKTTE
ncbi:MAG: hypothetical protein ACHQ1H_01260 [Nitrososphaerales archaeon]